MNWHFTCKKLFFWVALFTIGCDQHQSNTVDDNTDEAGKPESPRMQLSTETIMFIRPNWQGEHEYIPTDVTGMHAGYVEFFVKAPGVGIGRFNEWKLPANVPPAWVQVVPATAGESLPSLKDFEGQQFPYNIFHETLHLNNQTTRKMREQYWTLSEWALMSVNAPSGPAVYIRPEAVHMWFDLQSMWVCTQHTKMKALEKNSPRKTRELTPFESAALVEIRKGSDTIFHKTDSELRVLGVIRARQACLECHNVEVGAMLGAFTYRLELQSDAIEESEVLKDTKGFTAREIAAIKKIEARGGTFVRLPDGPVSELVWDIEKDKSDWRSYPTHVTWRRLHDSELVMLDAFPKLTVLDLSNSFITDDGILYILQLKHLKKLILTSTMVTQERILRLKQEMPNCLVIATDKVDAPEETPKKSKPTTPLEQK